MYTFEWFETPNHLGDVIIMTAEVQSPVELVEEVSRVLGGFTAEVMKHSACDMLRLIQRESLSMSRMVTLNYLRRRGSASISDISQYLNLALGTTSHLVDQLVDAQFVTRSEDASDRRLKLIMLTERGRDFADEVERTRIEALARHLAAMPAPLLGQTLEVMTQVTEFLKDEAID